uniref:Transposase IS200-like domain-containing protein n=1 Tax=Candidatus Kentrum sp. LFY TaxID=2126342 RepID=A0A450UNE3_9GAMM|nr:MAG: hypothetical protein BECKLFY1418B_GA0070995_10539 [Candidatus Kentron sp. LFY]
MNVAEKPIHHMTYDPKIHHRRSIRLRGYDYSRPETYFVTIRAQNRECLFGKIANGEMRSNDAGKIVAEEWRRTAAIRDEIELDEWVVMPNHVHGISIIVGGDCGGHRADNRAGDPPVAPAKSISFFGLPIPNHALSVRGEASLAHRLTEFQ